MKKSKRICSKFTLRVFKKFIETTLGKIHHSWSFEIFLRIVENENLRWKNTSDVFKADRSEVKSRKFYHRVIKLQGPISTSYFWNSSSKSRFTILNRLFCSLLKLSRISKFQILSLNFQRTLLPRRKIITKKFRLFHLKKMASNLLFPDNFKTSIFILISQYVSQGLVTKFHKNPAKSGYKKCIAEKPTTN